MEVTIQINEVGFVLISVVFVILFYKVRSDREAVSRYPQAVKKKDKQPTLF